MICIWEQNIADIACLDPKLIDANRTTSQPSNQTHRVISSAVKACVSFCHVCQGYSSLHLEAEFYIDGSHKDSNSDHKAKSPLFNAGTRIVVVHLHLNKNAKHCWHGGYRPLYNV